MTSGPLEVGGYQVRLQGRDLGVTAPGVDGYIAKMAADVVDVRTGELVPISRIMLHHIVFVNLGAPGRAGVQPFYGDGEERATMDLPPGYGYPIRSDDRWAWVWMLMNHRPVSRPGAHPLPDDHRHRRDAAEVVPVAWDTSRRRQGLVFDVPGRRAEGLARRAHDDAAARRSPAASSPGSPTSTAAPRPRAQPAHLRRPRALPLVADMGPSAASLLHACAPSCTSPARSTCRSFRWRQGIPVVPASRSR